VLHCAVFPEPGLQAKEPSLIFAIVRGLEHGSHEVAKAIDANLSLSKVQKTEFPRKMRQLA